MDKQKRREKKDIIKIVLIIMASLLLIFFAAGTFLGMLALVGKLYRQGREITRLKRELERSEMARVESLLHAPAAAAATDMDTPAHA